MENRITALRNDMEGMQLAALAHDLRTPMCCVMGAAQMALAAGKAGKDVSGQLQQILQAIAAMDGMISSAASGTKKDVFSGEMLEAELTAVCAPQAREKEQRLILDLSPLCGLRFSQDGGAIVRVLVNLLGNAIKYTPRGGQIALRAQALPWYGGAVWLRFAVTDNGMGMKRAFVRRMYHLHARAQESAQQPGEGLGLATVRSLVRRMGGRIFVRSKWGSGTAFTVFIPARRP